MPRTIFSDNETNFSRELDSDIKLVPQASRDRICSAYQYHEFSWRFFGRYDACLNSRRLCPMNYPCEIQTATLNHFPCIILTDDEVLNGLRSLRSSFVPGPNDAPTYILKSCTRELLILTKILNYSLKFGSFPSFWRSSFISPLHKSGNRRFIDISSFRIFLCLDLSRYIQIRFFVLLFYWPLRYLRS